jgi:hypothetical protein
MRKLEYKEFLNYLKFKNQRDLEAYQYLKCEFSEYPQAVRQAFIDDLRDYHNELINKEVALVQKLSWNVKNENK